MKPSTTVGVIGGGQLAWMMAQAAPQLGIKLIVQTPSRDDPAVSRASSVVLGAVDDAIATAELARRCEIITFENEFVDLSKLMPLAEAGVKFCPSLATLSPLLDKYQQRSYLRKLGLPVPDFIAWNGGESLGFPVVLKVRRHGYDGQGTYIINSQTELEATVHRLGGTKLMLEQFVPFQAELAVMAARNEHGTVVYPVVLTHQQQQVCRWVVAPAPISRAVASQVEAIATRLLDELDAVGIFGIELFLTKDEGVLINEIAPRTHNSGHYTLDACEVSQFEMQLRAVTNQSLPSPKLMGAGAVMVNLLGYEDSTDDYMTQRQQLASLPHTFVHWYDKTTCYPGRKMGHVTTLLEEHELEGAISMAQSIEAIWYRQHH